jgi:hypothetical protein
MSQPQLLVELSTLYLTGLFEKQVQPHSVEDILLRALSLTYWLVRQLGEDLIDRTFL